MKSKIVKKVIAASLATVMALGVMGCGDNTADTGNTNNNTNNNAGTTNQSSEAPASSDAATPTEEPQELSPYTVITDADGNPIDLGGIDVIIRDWWTADEEVEPSNAYEEAREEYFDWIQETYNFTIKQVAISSWASTPEDFANYATTGGDEYYVFVLRQGTELTAAMNSDLMYDLASLDCLDFSEEKWKDGVHNMFSKGDAIYGMRGVTPEARGGMYFNKRILEDAGIDPQEIYDLQESMEWTWDKFEEICSKVQADTDNDGVIDRHALVCVNQDFYPLAVYSNGGSYVGKDENGKYFNNVESAETIAALNWSVDMITNYAKVFASDAAWDYAYTAFQNGEGAFMPQEAYKAGEMKEMEDDFGFVCFPMGPQATDYTNCYQDNVYAIPSCYDADKAWKIAFAYNLYTEAIPGYEDYAGWKSSYYQNFRDTEAVDLTLTRMAENGMVTYHTFIPNLKINNDLHWSLSKDNTPAQQTESIRNTWNSYIDEANQ